MNQSIEIYEKLELPQKVLNSMEGIILINVVNKNPQNAELALKAMLERSKEEDITIQNDLIINTITTIDLIGEVWEEQKKFSKAIQYHKQSIILKRKQKTLTNVEWNLNRIGWNLEQLEQHEEAINYYQKALELQTYEKNKVQLFISIGFLYNKIGQYEMSNNSFLQLLSHSKGNKDTESQAVATSQIAWNYKELKQYHKAIEYHKKSANLTKKTLRPIYIWNIAHVGENYILLNQWNKAKALLNIDHKDNETIFNELGDAVAYTEKHQNLAKAFEVGNQLLSILEERKNWMDVNLSLSKLYAGWINMKISTTLFKDLCEEALSIFPEPGAQLITKAALHTIQYIESEKNPIYLESLDPDMAIAVQAIIAEARL